MEKADSILTTLRAVFQEKGYQIEPIKNGFRIDLSKAGLPCLEADFYTLSGKPGQLRAKIKSDGNLSPLEIPELESIQEAFQTNINRIATIEEFNYFGARDDAHIYYAYVAAKESGGQARKPEPISRATDSETLFKAAQIAIKQVESLDSKTLRRNLDQLGLARSSLVRLALTRVFRDSMDAEELLANVEEEAKKIVNTNEMDVLKKTKTTIKEQVPALNNVVQLLWLAVYQAFSEKTEKNSSE